MREALNSEVATKQNLENMELKIPAHLEKSTTDIIKWNTGTLLVATGLFAAISKIFH